MLDDEEVVLVVADSRRTSDVPEGEFSRTNRVFVRNNDRLP